MTPKITQPAIKDIIKELKSDNKLLLPIVDAIQEKKGQHIKILDLRAIDEAVADFFVIADASSALQMSAIADFVERQIREDRRERPFQFELSPTWTLIDYIDVVVHIFIESERKFYDLEGLWEDAAVSEIP